MDDKKRTYWPLRDDTHMPTGLFLFALGMIFGAAYSAMGAPGGWFALGMGLWVMAVIFFVAAIGDGREL